MERIKPEETIEFAHYMTGKNRQILEEEYKKFSRNYNGKKRRRYVSPNLVELVILKHFNIDKKDVYNKKRNTEIVYKRQLIQYMMRNYTTLNDGEIGKRTGGFKRIAILHNSKVIDNYYDTDEFKQQEIDKIWGKLLNYDKIWGKLLNYDKIWGKLLNYF